MNDIHHITCNGRFVGSIQNISQDMWYLDGAWWPADTPEVRWFDQHVAALVPENVLRYPQQGRIVQVTEEGGTGPGFPALVLGLADGRLLLRMVSDEGAAAL
ncbi:MAG TPA: hypothetical protein VHK69_01365 [Chitinophagaceae bacterium]|nr:hypothetical protein [Chitinophagaceae bacterium]